MQSVPAVAGDGSLVYFNASGDLAPHGEGGGLYRYDTLTHATVYVAPDQGYPSPALTRVNGSEWYDSVLGDGGASQSYAGLDVQAEYYTTADGGFLIFPSTQDIAGYDSGGKQELYRYDAEDQSVVCVSCNPSGATPSYGARFGRSAVRADNPAGTAPRPISEDGQYVFFDTQESLLAGDTNGKVDVYEWHEDPATHQGSLGSISTGQSSTDDFFLDSSPDGHNVFFGTHSKLVPADKDEQGDLYDARIEGGFPAPLGAGPCEGDACDHPPAAPADPTPSLLAAPSAVNLATAPPPPAVKKAVTCKKGFVKKKVKTKTECVKPKKKARAKKASHDRRTSR